MDGATVIRKRLRRAEVLSFFAGLEPCLIGMEACATSHYWARELAKFGHTVKLMPPAYVKPYVKRGKNDATDAEAICEAVTRPNMRFVPVKSADQQAVLMLHRTRALLIRQQTMLANAFRAHLAELGIVVAQGIRHVRALIDKVFGEDAMAETVRSKPMFRDACRKRPRKRKRGKRPRASGKHSRSSVHEDKHDAAALVPIERP